MHHAMIMAGGSGTRLWPMSRGGRPKQMVPLVQGRSLLWHAAQRLDGLVPPDRQWICTGESHRSLILDDLDGFDDARIIGEPCPRDTVNAVALTAAVLHKADPTAVFAVLTADHLITPQSQFAACIETGFSLVSESPNRMVTFGIEPTYAATGFGYVELGDVIEGHTPARNTVRFVEKPDEATAQSYLESGRFKWNSGMFVFSAAGFLEALERFVPESAAGMVEIAAAWGTPEQQDTLRRVYPTLPKVSVDYAIMEPASSDEHIQVCTVPMDVQWLDVGSWTAAGETIDPDEGGNRSFGPAEHVDSTGVITVSEDDGHLIATIGCEDLVIIHTPKATLVCPKDRVQEVKTLHGQVSEEWQ
ncbi:MAG: mannose-1-phosphate guanylyltransferase [Planctomycetes bacterium]|jgi:mannose-1-phosphate guanylyltransferase|nr:mannose-1-phosphate guanylyltransferase [Planctomycetota bacterium]MCP4837866.1 mannose-1-phosphate guanylyltransferase [Planctomycetota bacterium]